MTGASAGRERVEREAQPDALPQSAAGTPRVVVFDFGGVVFRWEPRELLMSVLGHHASDAESADALGLRIFQKFAVGSDWGEFDRGTIGTDALVERIVARTGLPPHDVLALVNAVPPHLDVQTGTVELMRRLKDAGHRLFYLSNMPAPFADELERIHPFFAWFEGGIFSARVHLIKPEPAIFELASKRFGVAPGDMVFIDDLPHNIDEARRSGWQGIVFRSPAQLEADLVSGGWL